jgi:hypothetical protein
VHAAGWLEAVSSILDPIDMVLGYTTTSSDDTLDTAKSALHSRQGLILKRWETFPGTRHCQDRTGRASENVADPSPASGRDTGNHRRLREGWSSFSTVKCLPPLGNLRLRCITNTTTIVEYKYEVVQDQIGSCHRARRDGRIGFVRSTGRRAVEAMLSLIGEVNGSGNRP